MEHAKSSASASSVGSSWSYQSNRNDNQKGQREKMEGSHDGPGTLAGSDNSATEKNSCEDLIPTRTQLIDSFLEQIKISNDRERVLREIEKQTSQGEEENREVNNIAPDQVTPTSTPRLPEKQRNRSCCTVF